MESHPQPRQFLCLFVANLRSFPAATISFPPPHSRLLLFPHDLRSLARGIRQNAAGPDCPPPHHRPGRPDDPRDAAARGKTAHRRQRRERRRGRAFLDGTRRPLPEEPTRPPGHRAVVRRLAHHLHRQRLRLRPGLLPPDRRPRPARRPRRRADLQRQLRQHPRRARRGEETRTRKPRLPRPRRRQGEGPRHLRIDHARPERRRRPGSPPLLIHHFCELLDAAYPA